MDGKSTRPKGVKNPPDIVVPRKHRHMNTWVGIGSHECLVNDIAASEDILERLSCIKPFREI